MSSATELVAREKETLQGEAATRVRQARKEFTLASVQPSRPCPTRWATSSPRSKSRRSWPRSTPEPALKAWRLR